MIIGRTDENDIVINHRSISRNHAKLVREPETSRYTISDLQSSNGVRVNGQDYGKVELRRGDVVDLGHVRLRFVEAGEDFVFARDAVITDVPETGGRRGMVVAIVAAILVVVAGIVVYTMRSSPDHPKDGVVEPSNVPAGAGSDATVDETAANAHGSDGVADAVAAPAVPAVAAGDDGKAQKLAQCADLNAQRKWQDLMDCAAGLDALGDKAKAKELRAKATAETANEIADGKVRQALRTGGYREAQTLLKAMSQDSVYHKSLSDLLDKADATNVEEARRRSQGYVNAHDCAGLKRYLAQQQTGATGTERVVVLVSAALTRCAEKAQQDPGARVAAGRGSGSANPAGTGSASAPPAVTPAPAKQTCDTLNVEDATGQAANQYANGFASAALNLMIKALNCKQDIRMYRLAAMYACAAHDLATAKTYFTKLPSNPPTMQSGIEQKCQQEGLNVRGP
jgi:hypothetical protein